MKCYKVYYRRDGHKFWRKGDLVLVTDKEPHEDLSGDRGDFVWVEVKVDDKHALEKLRKKRGPEVRNGTYYIREKLNNVDDVPPQHGRVQTPNVTKYMITRKRAKNGS